MSLDKAEITRLAQLAQLHVEPEEAERLAIELGKIMVFAVAKNMNGSLPH